MTIKERTCENCGATTKTPLHEFAEIGWYAFQIPAGNGKVKCLCNKPECSNTLAERFRGILWRFL